MHNYRLILAYDGTGFLGWQKTRMGPSIEETLQCALEKVLQHPIQLQAASRTDAGVHADGQVVNFFSEKQIDCARFILSLNSLLPRSIAVREASLASLTFHPTLDAMGKEYRYKICLGKVQLPFHRLDSWHLHEPNLDLKQVAAAIPLLLGTKDFIAFCNTRQDTLAKTTLCHLKKITLESIGPERIQLCLFGNRFLFRMARNLVGTLVDVGRKRLELDTLPRLFQGGQRCESGICAPAHGLSLHQVFYV